MKLDLHVHCMKVDLHVHCMKVDLHVHCVKLDLHVHCVKLDLHVHCMKLPHSTANTCMHCLLRIQPCSYQYIVCMVCACTCMQSCIGTVLLHYVHIELYMSYIRDCSCMYSCM